MKKILLSLLLIPLFFIFSCKNSTKTEARVSDTTKITVAGFAGQADSLIDKAVIIEGTVLHTCKHGGKRMFLVDNNNDSVTVEVVAGGEIVKFDDALIGSRVRVNGFLREEKIDTKYLNEWEAEVLKPKAEEAIGVHTGVKGHEDNTVKEKLDQINALRAQLKESGKDHLSNYSIEAASFGEIK